MGDDKESKHSRPEEVLDDDGDCAAAGALSGHEGGGAGRGVRAAAEVAVLRSEELRHPEERGVPGESGGLPVAAGAHGGRDRNAVQARAGAVQQRVAAAGLGSGADGGDAVSQGRAARQGGGELGSGRYDSYRYRGLSADQGARCGQGRGDRLRQCEGLATAQPACVGAASWADSGGPRGCFQRWRPGECRDRQPGVHLAAGPDAAEQFAAVG